MLIGLAGEIAAGKTTTARYLRQVLGFSTVSTRKLIKEYLDSRSAPKRPLLQERGHQLLDELGPTGVCELISDRLPDGDVTIDNLRMVESADFFRSEYGDDFRLLYIEAPPQVRLQRYLSRNPTKTEGDFTSADSHPIEDRSRSLRDSADVLLHNLEIGSYCGLLLHTVQAWNRQMPLLLLQDLLTCMKHFNETHGFSVGVASDEEMLQRQNLVIEEVGEISAALSKGRGNLGEEHADLLIVLLANCVARGIDIESEFIRKYNIIMRRPPRHMPGIPVDLISKPVHGSPLDHMRDFHSILNDEEEDEEGLPKARPIILEYQPGEQIELPFD